VVVVSGAQEDAEADGLCRPLAVDEPLSSLQIERAPRKMPFMPLFKALADRKARQQIKKQLKTGQRLLDGIEDVPEAAAKRLREALARGRGALNKEEEAQSAAHELEAAIYQSDYKGHTLSPAIRSLLELAFYVALALTIRAFFFEPFKIPTGSMRPTLLHGDHVFIKKYRYGPRYPFTATRIWNGEPPRRGEIVVFNFPMDPRQDYIKRVVGLPGDKLRIVDGSVEVNGTFLEQREGGKITYLRTDERRLEGHPVVGNLVFEKLGPRWVQTIHGPDIHPFYNDWPRAYFMHGTSPGPVAFDRPGSGLECTPHHCTVKPGFLFMMGDNRDGSADSRVWGGVPMKYLRGTATMIWFSHDWTDPMIPAGAFTIGALRWSRMFSDVNAEPNVD